MELHKTRALPERIERRGVGECELWSDAEIEAAIRFLQDELEARILCAVELDDVRRACDVVARETCGGWTYQQEYRRCGKGNCHCASGKGHGPYWYAYRRWGGKLRARYVGKSLGETTKAQAAEFDRTQGSLREAEANL